MNREATADSVRLLILSFFLALTSGCSFISSVGGSLNDAGRNLSAGAVQGLSEQDTTLQRLVDSIVTTLGVSGNRQAVLLRDSLLGERTRALLSALERDLGTGLTATATGLRDSLLGPHTRQWILNLERDIASDLVATVAGMRDNLLGEGTVNRLEILRNRLLGTETAILIAALRDSALGPGMREQIALLRDELLGPETRSRVDSMVQSLTDHLQRVTQEEESFLKKHITEILWTVGGIIALLLVLGALLMRREKQYKEMLKLLTFQINEIDDTGAYDRLTAQIQKDAQRTGLEKRLRQLLADQGLLGEDQWKNRLSKEQDR